MTTAQVGKLKEPLAERLGRYLAEHRLSRQKRRAQQRPAIRRVCVTRADVTKSAPRCAKSILGSITEGLSSSGVGPDEFIATLITGALDLEGDRTLAKGVQPASGTIPLLWQHSAPALVGKADYRVVGEKVVIRCTFMPVGTSPEVDLARAAVKGGFATGVSAGFQVLQSSPIKGTRGKVYEKILLLEASIVSVPADPSARVTARHLSENPDRADRMAHAQKVLEKSDRRLRALELMRKGCEQEARHKATPPTPPLSKEERKARARAVFLAGMPAHERRIANMPAGPNKDYELAAQHARRASAAQFAHDWETGATRETRMAKAAEIIRRSRPGN